MTERRLCITGTRLGRLDTVVWLNKWVAAYGAPALVIVGDSDDWTPYQGVDGQARRWAERRGFVIAHERCIPVLRSPWRFYERDDRMVSHLRNARDHCLALPHPHEPSRGTLFTARLARQRGATVHVVRENLAAKVGRG